MQVYWICDIIIDNKISNTLTISAPTKCLNFYGHVETFVENSHEQHYELPQNYLKTFSKDFKTKVQ